MLLLGARPVEGQEALKAAGRFHERNEGITRCKILKLL
jgi:hypothetical protein